MNWLKQRWNKLFRKQATEKFEGDNVADYGLKVGNSTYGSNSMIATQFSYNDYIQVSKLPFEVSGSNNLKSFSLNAGNNSKLVATAYKFESVNYPYGVSVNGVTVNSTFKIKSTTTTTINLTDYLTTINFIRDNLPGSNEITLFKINSINNTTLSYTKLTLAPITTEAYGIIANGCVISENNISFITETVNLNRHSFFVNPQSHVGRLTYSLAIDTSKYYSFSSIHLIVLWVLKNIKSGLVGTSPVIGFSSNILEVGVIGGVSDGTETLNGNAEIVQSFKIYRYTAV